MAPAPARGGVTRGYCQAVSTFGAPSGVRTDVVIIGAGPAGLATAIAASRRGLRCLVVDARTPPLDKACGEGVLPHGVIALAKLGILPDSEISFPFRGIRFADRRQCVCARFAHGPGLAVRRVRLHELLAGAAAQAGVRFLWNSPVTQWTPGEVVAGGVRIACRWLVGADGQNSTARRWAGLGAFRLSARRFSFRRHFQVTPWSDCVEVHWGEGCQIVVTPTGPDEVGAAVISRNPYMRLADAVPLFPALAGKLRRAAPASTEMGSATALIRVPRVTRDRLALVGDAAGTVDALSGHGLSLGFLQALELAEAISHEDLGGYERAHRAVFAAASKMTRVMLAMAGCDLLRQGALAWLGASPRLFSRLLEVHTGTASWPAAAAQELTRLLLKRGWKRASTGEPAGPGPL